MVAGKAQVQRRAACQVGTIHPAVGPDRCSGASQVHPKTGREIGGNRVLVKTPITGSANLATDQKFNDFKLHLEFRVPKGANSGVYLRGRYELQIDDSAGLEPSSHHLGGVYGFIAPSENAARPAGEWQSMDVTLVGRMITYDLNGTTIICNREIPGITGGALDSAEAEPGPLLLQGDHGPIEYRNIVITPATSGR